MKRQSLLTRMLLLFALIVGSGSSMWAADETIDLSTKGYSNGEEVTTVSGSDFSITFNKGTNNNTPKYYDNKVVVPAVRVYGGGYFTVSSGTKNITKIELTFGSGDSDNTITTDKETYSDGTWTGDATSVKFTIGGTSGNRRIASVAVTYKTDNRTAVNMTSFSATKTSLIVGDEVTTSVTNDQTGWTAAYTYSSDDEDIATIAADGTITAVAKGSTTVRATLNVDKDDPSYKKGSTYTRSIDITVNNPSHNVVFSINGVAGDPISVEEGDNIDFPDVPTTLGGKTFVGWKAGSGINGTTDVAPSLKSSDTMSNEDVTYYAVYALEAIGVGEITKSYGFETASDADWTIDGPVRDHSNANSGEYAGKINTNNTYITFKNKVNVTEFSFAFKRTSNNENYNVYVETSTDNSTWKAAETYAMSGFENGTYTTKTKTFDGENELYVRFHCYNTTAVRYVDDVTIKYNGETKTYSSYCTSITEPITITDAGYATYVSDNDLNYEGVTGLKAYKATVSGTTITFTKVTTVPAGEGVLLQGNAGDYNIPVTTGVAAWADDANAFIRGTGAAVASGVGPFNYILNKVDDVVGFYKANGQTVAANRAYLQSTTNNARIGLSFDDETTGISAVENVEPTTTKTVVFNLNGQRIANPSKGLYIVNGKKVIIK